MELHTDRNAAQRTVAVVRQVEPAKDRAPDQVDRLLQATATPLGHVWEYVPPFRSVTDYLGLLVPATAFPHNRHRDDLAIPTDGGRLRSSKQALDLLLQFINAALHLG
ncbi:MAG TPA: hypothetical protein VGW38_24735 [Chloroflexota bacterium]|nr:hypothetical protein [Chloroflexota bacterium]